MNAKERPEIPKESPIDKKRDNFLHFSPFVY